MRIFIILVFLIINSFCTAFARTEQTTITNLCLNENEQYDIEILTVSDNIYIPVKQIAKIFNLPVNVNHSKKEADFLNFENQNIIVNKKGVFSNNKKITESVKFQKDGIIEADEFFIDKDAAENIFNSIVAIDTSSLCVNIFNKYINQKSENISEKKKEDKNILQPKEKGKISFDTLELNNSMMNDSTKQVYLNSIQNNVMFNNNTRMSLKGKLYGGDYALNFNTNNYT